MAQRGTEVEINQEFTSQCKPRCSDQTRMTFFIYYTRNYNAVYCDEPDMDLLGKLHIDLPGSGLNRIVLFGLTFGEMEITATLKNKQTGQSYKTTFKFSED